MFGVGLGFMGLGRVRGRNEERRRALMGRLGMRECEVQQGEKGRAPRRVGRRCVVGFWHPYWYVLLQAYEPWLEPCDRPHTGGCRGEKRCEGEKDGDQGLLLHHGYENVYHPPAVTLIIDAFPRTVPIMIGQLI